MRTRMTSLFKPSLYSGRFFSSQPNFLKYIKNNVKMAQLPTHSPEIQTLFSAIKTGNHQANSFSHPACSTHLLALIKQEKLSLAEGMTVYTYLMALMQFTSKQLLKKEDQDVKFIRDISVDQLIEKQKISKVGASYLKKTCSEFLKLGYIINYEELTQLVLSLPAAEQWLLKIKYDPGYFPLQKSYECDRATDLLLDTVPFLQSVTGRINQYWVPSMTLINFFFKKMSVNPVLLEPIFGSISLNTLHELHQQGKHPGALYSVDVRSNVRNADGYRSGPFIIWLHDVAHTFWLNLLSFDERQKIFKQFIPALQSLVYSAQEHHDHDVITMLNTMIIEMGDFNLTPLKLFGNRERRLETYLMHSFHKVDMNFPSEYANAVKIGCKVDRLLFLLHQMAHDSRLSDEEKDQWKRILTKIKTNRDEEVIQALCILADPSKKFLAAEANEPIDWQAWFNLLDEHTHPEAFWEAAIDTRQDELLKLITRYHFKIFYPYLPLTDEKRELFREFLTVRVAVTAAKVRAPY
jgi:hypothetical protein